MKFRPCIDIHNGKVNRLSEGAFGIRETRRKRISRQIREQIILRKCIKKTD